MKLTPKNDTLHELFERYQASKGEIQSKLAEFKNVPKEEHFYELCFCICTPQSKALHALKVVENLKTENFFLNPFDATDILRNPEHYIRFHNQKAKNLVSIQMQWSTIAHQLSLDTNAIQKRDWLSENIRGIGMEESAHFLRNIGEFGVAILDRHILKHLVELNVIDEYPVSMNRKLYLEIERKWKEFCEKVHIPMEEMDLLFWSMETGVILK
ncbi:MAG: DNA lyase [Ignavibacteria bacterium]|nr:DNA lyase [Ignavibacteria bacterium]